MSATDTNSSNYGHVYFQQVTDICQGRGVRLSRANNQKLRPRASTWDSSKSGQRQRLRKLPGKTWCSLIFCCHYLATMFAFVAEAKYARGCKGWKSIKAQSRADRLWIVSMTRPRSRMHNIRSYRCNYNDLPLLYMNASEVVRL